MVVENPIKTSSTFRCMEAGYQLFILPKGERISVIKSVLSNGNVRRCEKPGHINQSKYVFEL